MTSYKLLIIGDLCDNHLIRYIKNLKNQNPSASIDVLSTMKDYEYSKELCTCINNIFWFTPKTINIKYIRVFDHVRQYNNLLRQISQNNHYNVVNIHYPKVEYCLSVKYFKQLADKILLSPWGSDVYRVGKRKLAILKYLYRKADFVCASDTRFGKDLCEIFKLLPIQKVNLQFGSETIDYISEYKNITSVSEARKKLFLEGDFFITCGYNASPAQNHKAIIDGVAKAKLYGQIVLLFPMTYPKNVAYVDEIKSYVEKRGLKAYFFTDYLDLPTLFNLRQSTDMFIHVQNTDANAASVQEYLLLGKKVLNGEWLRYDNMEIDGDIPYTLVQDLNSISNAIETALADNKEISANLYEYIKSSGWKNWIIKWDTFFSNATF